ncbi:MAG TPA: hypothetical protein VI522_04170 [Gammaproteobacteria bacterium]|nr:hypothetical protein [Gammaproteobacteria bacterium]
MPLPLVISNLFSNKTNEQKDVISEFEGRLKSFTPQAAFAHAIIFARGRGLADMSFLYPKLGQLVIADKITFDLNQALKGLTVDALTCLPIVEALLGYAQERNNLTTLSITIPCHMNSEDLAKLSAILEKFFTAPPSKLASIALTLAPGAGLLSPTAISSIMHAATRADSNLHITLTRVPLPITRIAAGSTMRLILIDCPKVISENKARAEKKYN